MSTRLVALACMVAIGCGGKPAPVDPAARQQAAAAAVGALQGGDFAGARTAATTVLAADGHNASAAAVRAIAAYQDAGARLRADFMKALESGGDKIDHARFRAIEQRFADDLAAVDGDLAVAAADPGFSLELCLACWRHDWNQSGELDDGDQRLFEIEYDRSGAELPEGDPRRRPTFRFDTGDVHWARAMVDFQRATFELLLAYKWNELDKLLASLFSSDLPTITIRLADASRVHKARDLILAGLAEAERARDAYLAETDDDREWVPAPDQRDHPVPLPMDQATYDTWSGVIGDVRRLIAGDEGLSIAELSQVGEHHWDHPPTGFIDVHALLEKPGDLVIDFEQVDRLDDAPVRDDPKTAGALLHDLLGRGLVATMKPSPLVGRLVKIRGELDRNEDTVDRKLRYFLWMN